MGKIALVFPKSTFLTDPMTWMPLGLMYLGAQLEAQGHQIEFFDMSIHNLPKDGDFDQLWVSATTPQVAAVREISEITKHWEKTVTVLGGPIVTVTPNEKPPFDVFVSGEADHPDNIKYILHAIKSKSNHPAEISIVNTPGDLNWVLPPIRRWSKLYHSYMSDRNGKQHRMTSMFITRGCSFNCAFCATGRGGRVWGDKVRFEPMEIVEAQMREIRDLGFDGVAHYDDLFIMHRQRADKLFELHKKYGLAWRCFTRTDLICKFGGKEYLQKMQDSGLIEIFVGVESADNQIKRNIHKGTTIEQDTQVIEWCKELGIICKCSIIIGLPGETWESLNKTRDWILKYMPERVGLNAFIPFSGTPIVMHRDEYDIAWDTELPDEYFLKGRSGMGDALVHTSHLTREEINKFWHDLDREITELGIKP
jgi:anaerobic magnesium-protoporphyrin IX monomethyl ester cyclase